MGKKTVKKVAPKKTVKRATKKRSKSIKKVKGQPVITEFTAEQLLIIRAEIKKARAKTPNKILKHKVERKIMAQKRNEFLNK